jgi:hypothetical protein
LTQRYRLYPLSAWLPVGSRLSSGEYGAASGSDYQHSVVSHNFVGSTANKTLYRHTFTFSPPDPLIKTLGAGNHVEAVFVDHASNDMWMAEKFAPASTSSFNLISTVGSLVTLETYPVHVLLAEELTSQTGDYTGY